MKTFVEFGVQPSAAASPCNDHALKFVRYVNHSACNNANSLRRSSTEYLLIAWPKLSTPTMRYHRHWVYIFSRYNINPKLVTEALSKPDIHRLELDICWQRLESHLQDVQRALEELVLLEECGTPNPDSILSLDEQQARAEDMAIGASVYARLYWTHIKLTLQNQP